MIQSENYSKITTLEELYSYLKRFALCDSLFVIGLVNAAMRYGFKKLDENNIPKNVIFWINQYGTDPKSRAYITIQLTRLSRFLLLSQANDYKSAVLNIETTEMQQAIYLTASLFDKEVEGEIHDRRDLMRIFGRTSQWQFPLQENRLHIIGRGYLLFIEIPKEVQLLYNFEEKVREYFGMGVFQYIATGIALWMTATGILKYNMKVEVKELQNVVTKESINKFIELSTGTSEKYRRLIRRDNWKISNKKLDIYGLDPFVQIPVVKVEHSRYLENDSYVLPQPYYLLQKATMGLFYLLADKEQVEAETLNQDKRNDFRESFGNIYRIYVKKQLALVKLPTTLIDLDEIIIKGKKPDFALVEDKICILFEVKTALLTVDSRTIFDETTVHTEIKQGKFKKALEQLCEFEDALNNKKVKDTRLANVTDIIKVIVGFEDIFLANAFLLPILKDFYGDKTNNLQITTINDIDVMGTLFANRIRVGELLLNKVSTPDFIEWAVGAFLNHQMNIHHKNPLLEKGFNDFMQRITGKDYAFVSIKTNTDWWT